MKKTFLKVSLFSLMLGALPVVTLTGCKDYDSDIDGLTQRDDTLQKEINDKLSQQSEALGKQITALETSLNSYKAEADNANNAAKTAAAAAQTAQAAADKAQQAGDAAQAAANQADAKAQAANAEALAAQAAAANAKADAIAETIKQVQALRSDVNSQIDQLKATYGEQFTALTNGLANAATAKDLNDAVAKLEASIASSGMSQAQLEHMLSAYLTQINVNTTNITALSGRIDGLDTSINSLAADLGGKIGANASSITKNAQDIAAANQSISANTAEIAKNALAIQAEASRINDIINTVVPGIDQKIAALDTKFTTLDSRVTTEVAAFNTALTNANTQIAALETFKDTYQSLLQNLNGIDFAGIQTRLAAAEADLTAAQAEIVKNAGEITTINGKIVTIEGDITSIQGLITTLQSKDSAIEASITGINGNITSIQGLITDLQTADGNLRTKISDINGTLTDLDTAIKAVDKKLTDQGGINDKISAAQADIVKINAALSTLSNSLSKRLTSVTLVPTSYVGGIPSIEFYTATYTPLGKLDDKTGIYAAPAATAKAVSVNNNNTQVLYRLNPSGVQLTDIKASEVTFVQQIATSRAAADAVIKATNVTKTDDGLLAVTAVKNDTKSVDNAGAGKIYTVALKVPVAEKNYLSWTDAEGNTVKESAEDAVVYSEYCRISDTAFTPEIAKVGSKPVDHFSDKSIWDVATNVSQEVSFVSEGYDLTELVTGCMAVTGTTDHILMTAEQLESFGFTLEFSVPKKAYTVANVDQQQFAAVSGNTLTPVVPKNFTQADLVGKTPIISAVMKQGNNVVAQRFFKIEFTVGKAGKPEIDFGSKTLQCNDMIWTVNWADFNSKFIAQLGFPMTQAEFVANYSVKSADEGVEVNLNADEKKKENVITWTLAADEMKDLDGKDKDFPVEIVFESNNNFPDVTLILTCTVQWPTLFPTFGETVDAYWKNNTMEILPKAMPNNDPNAKAEYDTNVLIGRVAPYFNNFMSCGTWDVVVKSISGISGYLPFDSYDVWSVDAKDKKVEKAATLWYNNNHTSDLTASQAGIGQGAKAISAMNFFIYPTTEENGVQVKNEAAIALVENEAEITLEWNSLLNGQIGNNYTIGTTNIKIIKPLKSVQTQAVTPLVQDSKVQTRDLGTNLTIYDCFNNPFKYGSQYWNYYGIDKIEWSNDLSILAKNGKTYSLDTYNMTGIVDENTGKLTFTGSGIVLQESVELIVPVIVHHMWGKLETTVKVTINPYENL